MINIIVEGMTASGKSTLTNLLAERLKLDVMPEEFRDNYDLLGRFHHNRKWAFPMQLNFLVTRFAQYLCALEEGNYIMDRSLFGDKVYAKLYYELGYLSDGQFGQYLNLYESLAVNVKQPKLLIHVHCEFNEIMRRINSRGRQDEIDVGRDYWQSLYNAYESVKFPNEFNFDLSNPEFINTPEMIEKFLADVREHLS